MRARYVPILRVSTSCIEPDLERERVLELEIDLNAARAREENRWQKFRLCTMTIYGSQLTGEWLPFRNLVAATSD